MLEKGNIFQKELFKKWFKRENLVLLVLAGILLFVIALPVKKDGDSRGGSGTSRTGTSQGQPEGGQGDSPMVQEQDYARYLEERLRDTLSGMAEVGKVEVMITLQSSEELVVEKDSAVSTSSTSEEDSQGGSRSVVNKDTGESTVYKGGTEEPYVVKTMMPAVEGVVVVAEGAGNGRVSRDITQIVQALFGVEAHKIKVVKMGEG